MATPDLTFNIPGQQPPAPAEPACSRQDGPAGEPNLEELLDYYPVPFRRTVTVAVRYQLTGRRKPLLTAVGFFVSPYFMVKRASLK